MTRPVRPRGVPKIVPTHARVQIWPERHGGEDEVGEQAADIWLVFPSCGPAFSVRRRLRVVARAHASGLRGALAMVLVGALLHGGRFHHGLRNLLRTSSIHAPHVFVATTLRRQVCPLLLQPRQLVLAARERRKGQLAIQGH